MARAFTPGDDLAAHERALDKALADAPAVVTVYGDDEFLRRAALDALAAKADPGAELAVLHGPGRGGDAGASFPDVLEELAGGGLFAAEKTVLLRRAGGLLFPAKADDEETPPASGPRGGRGAKKTDPRERFAAWLDEPAPGVRLLLETDSLPRNRALGKKLAALATVPCPTLKNRDVERWLAGAARARGLALDRDAAALLVEAHGARLGMLAGELDKLALFADGERLAAEHVRAFLTGTIEFDLFGLTNALEARDLPSAVAFAARVATQGARNASGKREEGKNAVHMALGMAANSAELLFRAKTAGGGELRGQSEWRARKLREAAARYRFPEIRKNLALAAEEIRAAHDTGGDGRLALERLALLFTRP